MGRSFVPSQGMFLFAVTSTNGIRLRCRHTIGRARTVYVWGKAWKET